MAQGKESIITFKADKSLVDALRGLPNRSAFIRSAVLAALESTCPLCQGTGILTPDQQTHWQDFSESHVVQECTECHEWHLVCVHDSGPSEPNP
jgi:hypothetical protein